MAPPPMPPVPPPPPPPQVASTSTTTSAAMAQVERILRFIWSSLVRSRLRLPPRVVAQPQRLHRIQVLALADRVGSLIGLRHAQEHRVLAVVVRVAAGVGLLRHHDVGDVR